MIKIKKINSDINISKYVSQNNIRRGKDNRSSIEKVIVASDADLDSRSCIR